jgi:transposase
MTVEERAAALRPTELVALLVQNAEWQRQVEWCKRQLFGQKSERRLRAPEPQPLSLSGLLTTAAPPADRPPPPTETVKASHRRVRFAADDPFSASELRFAASVPVHEIVLTNPAAAALSPDADAVIGEKVTDRLAPRPGAYVMLNYVRPVIKGKDTAVLLCAPAPPAVFEKSFAAVSVLAGVLSEKFGYHLPRYRQPQR